MGPPVGGPVSTHWNDVLDDGRRSTRNIPIEPAAWTKSVMKPMEPVSATISSRSSAPRDSRISAIRTNLAARSAGFIHGHGPSSNALRAASIARTASLVDASATLPIDLLGGGVDDVDLAAALAFGPLAVDEEVVVPRRAHGFSLVIAKGPSERN